MEWSTATSFRMKAWPAWHLRPMFRGQRRVHYQISRFMQGQLLRTAVSFFWRTQGGAIQMDTWGGGTGAEITQKVNKWEWGRTRSILAKVTKALLDKTQNWILLHGFLCFFYFEKKHSKRIWICKTQFHSTSTKDAFPFSFGDRIASCAGKVTISVRTKILWKKKTPGFAWRTSPSMKISILHMQEFT